MEINVLFYYLYIEKKRGKLYCHLSGILDNENQRSDSLSEISGAILIVSYFNFYCFNFGQNRMCVISNVSVT